MIATPLRSTQKSTERERDVRGEAGAPLVHQPYFRAGIVVILTLGATWGAYLLLRIAVAQNFTAAGLHEVNAHGHAQIMGWVGLFVMGSLSQFLPRFKRVTLPYPRLATAALPIMAAGIVLRSVFQPFVAVHTSFAIPAVAGSVSELVAIGMFLYVVVQVFRRSLFKFTSTDYYIATALLWFVLQAVYETVYFVVTVGAPDRDALLALTATWQAPLRELQIHGFAMIMIFGVSQHILMPFFGMRPPRSRRCNVLLVMLTAGLLSQMSGFVLMRAAGHAWAALWYGGVLLLAVSALMMTLELGVFGKTSKRDRSLKFVRTAYAWLLLSLAMLVILPGYQFGLLRSLAPDSHAAEIGFSHAYYGATRHAITVGFISLMIMGVSARVVPQFLHDQPRRLPSLWLPFILVNLGCTLRVTMQVLTDFHPVPFAFAGVSGMLEVAGLAIWGMHLLSLMRRVSSQTDDPIPVMKRQSVPAALTTMN